MSKHSGFTLVELIVTVIIISIIAMVAVPIFFNNSAFDTRIFRDEVSSALRYAQKKAVASRRNVCATFTQNSVTLTAASAYGSAAQCDTVLTGPSGTPNYIVQARNQASFSVVPNPLVLIFDSMGQPDGGAQVLQIAGNPPIAINGVTGYVD